MKENINSLILSLSNQHAVQCDYVRLRCAIYKLLGDRTVQLYSDDFCQSNTTTILSSSNHNNNNNNLLKNNSSFVASTSSSTGTTSSSICSTSGKNDSVMNHQNVKPSIVVRLNMKNFDKEFSLLYGNMLLHPQMNCSDMLLKFPFYNIPNAAQSYINQSYKKRNKCLSEEHLSKNPQKSYRLNITKNNKEKNQVRKLDNYRTTKLLLSNGVEVYVPMHLRLAFDYLLRNDTEVGTFRKQSTQDKSIKLMNIIERLVNSYEKSIIERKSSSVGSLKENKKNENVMDEDGDDCGDLRSTDDHERKMPDPITPTSIQSVNIPNLEKRKELVDVISISSNFSNKTNNDDGDDESTQMEFPQLDKVKMNDFIFTSIHVGAIVKDFIRQLNPPILPKILMDLMLPCITLSNGYVDLNINSCRHSSDDTREQHQLKNNSEITIFPNLLLCLCCLLPQYYLHSFCYMMDCFNQIASESKNRMNAKAIAICLAPTITDDSHENIGHKQKTSTASSGGNDHQTSSTNTAALHIHKTVAIITWLIENSKLLGYLPRQLAEEYNLIDEQLNDHRHSSKNKSMFISSHDTSQRRKASLKNFYNIAVATVTQKFKRRSGSVDHSLPFASNNRSYYGDKSSCSSKCSTFNDRLNVTDSIDCSSNNDQQEQQPKKLMMKQRLSINQTSLITPNRYHQVEKLTSERDVEDQENLKYPIGRRTLIPRNQIDQRLRRHKSRKDFEEQENSLDVTFTEFGLNKTKKKNQNEIDSSKTIGEQSKYKLNKNCVLPDKCPKSSIRQKHQLSINQPVMIKNIDQRIDFPYLRQKHEQQQKQKKTKTNDQITSTMMTTTNQDENEPTEISQISSIGLHSNDMSTTTTTTTSSSSSSFLKQNDLSQSIKKRFRKFIPSPNRRDCSTISAASTGSIMDQTRQAMSSLCFKGTSTSPMSSASSTSPVDKRFYDDYYQNRLYSNNILYHHHQQRQQQQEQEEKSNKEENENLLNSNSTIVRHRPITSIFSKNSRRSTSVDIYKKNEKMLNRNKHSFFDSNQSKFSKLLNRFNHKSINTRNVLDKKSTNNFAQKPPAQQQQQQQSKRLLGMSENKRKKSLNATLQMDQSCFEEKRLGRSRLNSDVVVSSNERERIEKRKKGEDEKKKKKDLKKFDAHFPMDEEIICHGNLRPVEGNRSNNSYYHHHHHHRPHHRHHSHHHTKKSLENDSENYYNNQKSDTPSANKMKTIGTITNKKFLSENISTKKTYDNSSTNTLHPPPPIPPHPKFVPKKVTVPFPVLQEQSMTPKRPPIGEKKSPNEHSYEKKSSKSIYLSKEKSSGSSSTSTSSIGTMTTYSSSGKTSKRLNEMKKLKRNKESLLSIASSTDPLNQAMIEESHSNDKHKQHRYHGRRHGEKMKTNETQLSSSASSSTTTVTKQQQQQLRKPLFNNSSVCHHTTSTELTPGVTTVLRRSQNLKDGSCLNRKARNSQVKLTERSETSSNIQRTSKMNCRTPINSYNNKYQNRRSQFSNESRLVSLKRDTKFKCKKENFGKTCPKKMTKSLDIAFNDIFEAGTLTHTPNNLRNRRHNLKSDRPPLSSISATTSKVNKQSCFDDKENYQPSDESNIQNGKHHRLNRSKHSRITPPPLSVDRRKGRMRVPQFSDLSKSCKDLFNKGYHGSEKKLTVKTKAENGLNFTGTFVQKNDETNHGSLEAKYRCLKHNITLTEKLSSDNNYKISAAICDKLLTDLETTVELSANITDVNRREATIKNMYSNSAMTVNADVNILSQILRFAAVTSYNNWMIGGEAVWRENAIQRHNLTVGYMANDLHVHGNIFNKNEITTYVYQKLNDQIDAGFHILVNPQTASRPIVGFAAKYKANPLTTFQAKLTTGGTMGLSVTQALSRNLKVTLSEIFNADRKGIDFGIGLEFNN
ncbi:hypothetical protein SNEBB_003450 [Seison nebaliae]|nr:hypothetical protein SNEBB_003450 [Seison nebaliae]